MADYINKYPVLNQPGGHLLVCVFSLWPYLKNVFKKLFLFYLYYFQQLEYDFAVLFKEAENRMLTHWPQFSVKVKHKLIIAGVRDESLGESDFFFLEFLKLYVSP